MNFCSLSMLSSKNFIFLIFISAVVLLIPSTSIAQTIYVDVSATGAENGTSWTDAYTSLQDAIAAAGSSDEIWIAEGVYYPDEGANATSGDSEASFTIDGSQNGLKIYGGFESGDDFDDRSPNANPVVLSGDIDENDENKTPSGATPTADDIVGDNSNHVLIFDSGDGIRDNVDENITSTTILDGVTVSGGEAEFVSIPKSDGGGLHCDGRGSGNVCSPKIFDVNFKGNFAVGGGAVFNNGKYSGESSPEITNSRFSGNSGTGGAIYNGGREGNSSPVIKFCLFENNSTEIFGGGAIYNDGRSGISNPEITRSWFRGNSSSDGNGGAIRSSGTSRARINRVVFANNSASVRGGAIFGSSAQITNTLFVGNSSFEGGAVYNTSNTKIINTTFTDNSADSGGAIYNRSSSPRIVNTILWGNTTSSSDGEEIYNEDATPTLSHSLIQGGLASITEDGESSTTDGGGNIDADPLFVDPSDPKGSDDLLGTRDDGLLVIDGSPVLDAGDNDALDTDGDGTRDLTTDVTPAFGSHPRVVKNDPSATTATVDIGAFEAPDTVLPVELTNFTVQRQSEANLLQWQTVSEQNNAGFEIQRRVSSGWESISFVEGAGTTSNPQTYRFQDSDLPYEASSIDYRLKQIDTDGSASFSDVRTLKISAPDRFTLHAPFPNPARRQVTLRYALPRKADVSIRIYDVLGRKVETLQRGTEDAGRKKVQVSASRLSPGTYFVRMQAGEKIETKQLTVVR